MGLVGFIARRPWVVISLWLIVAVVSAPLFASLSKVTIYGEEAMLPSSVESAKASELLKEVAGNKTDMDILLVVGVDVASPETVEKLAQAYLEANSSIVGVYASSVTGFPEVAYKIRSVAVNESEKIVDMLSSLAKAMYESGMEASKGLTKAIEEVEKAVNQSLQLKEAVVRVDEGYHNITSMLLARLEDARKAAEAVASLDRAYATAYENVTRAAQGVKKLAEAISMLDRAYVNATRQLLEEYDNVTRLAAMLRGLDKAYSRLYQALALASKSMEGLRSLVESPEKTQKLVEAFAYAWWQVARTVYYYEKLGSGYVSATNLTMVNPGLAPLPPPVAEKLARMVHGYVAAGLGYDEACALAASQLLADQYGGLPPQLVNLTVALYAKALAEAKAAYNASSLAEAVLKTAPLEAVVESQLRLLKLATSLSAKVSQELPRAVKLYALESLAKKLAEQGLPMDVARQLAEKTWEGTISPRDVAEALASRLPRQLADVAARLLVELDPEARGILAGEPQQLAGAIQAILARMGVPAKAARVLAEYAAYNKTLTRSTAARLAAELVASKAAEAVETRMKLPVEVLVELLERYDPNASGVLVEGEALTEAVAGVLSKLKPELADILGSSGLRALVQAALSGDEAKLRSLALDLVRSQALSHAPPEARKLIGLAANIVAKYDPEATGLLDRDKKLLAEALTELLEAAMKHATAKTPLPAKALHKATKKLALVAVGLEGKEALYQLARSMLVEATAKMMEKQGISTAPLNTTTRELAARLVGVVVHYDPEGEGRLASDNRLAVRAVVDLVYQLAGGKVPLARSKLEELLLEPEKAKEVAVEVFQSKAQEMLEERLAGAPEPVKEAFSRILDYVVEREGKLSSDELWSLVGRLVEDAAVRLVKELGAKAAGVEVGEDVVREAARAATEYARGLVSREEAVERVYKLLLFSMLPSMVKKLEGFMVGRDGHSFIVMYTPLGGSDEEKYGNSVMARDKLTRILEKHLGPLARAWLADGEGSSVKVYWTGSVALRGELRTYGEEEARRISMFSEVLVPVVLLAILGSLLAVALPYIGIGLGILVGGALVYLAASTGLLPVYSYTRVLMITTCLGLGADYAGYIIYRFREEYAKHGDKVKAVEVALARAGPAVVASALTVMIGFGCLALGWEFPFLKSLGLALPMAVAATAAASLTLVPALLSVAGGSRLFWWPRKPKALAPEARSRLVAVLSRHGPLIAIVLAMLLALLVSLLPCVATTHDIKLMMPHEAPTIKAFEELTSELEPGTVYPVYVVLELPGDAWTKESLALVEEAAKRITAEVPYAAKVLGPTRPYGEPLEELNLIKLEEMGAKRFVKGRIAYMQVVLSVNPFSREAIEAVREIRSVVKNEAVEHGFKAYVGGMSAIVLDLGDVINEVFWSRVLPSSVLLMLLAFSLVFGSPVPALVALTVVVTSALAGLEVTALFSNTLYGEPILWLLPQMVFAAIMGVGMDYNSFYLARAREECLFERVCGSEGVARASAAVSLFIVGLAMVLVAAYASLLTASSIGMKQIGLALLSSVLVVSVSTAYLLTPPVIAALGQKAWWPKKPRTT